MNKNMQNFEMMTKSLLKSTLGFEDLFRELNNKAFDKYDNFPRYNFFKKELEGENKVEHYIELCLAGYQKNELSVSTLEDNLIVKSKIDLEDKKEQEERTFVYGNVAKRNFSFKVKISKNIEVVSAEMKNGILIVKLIEELPTKKEFEIDIK